MICEIRNLVAEVKKFAALSEKFFRYCIGWELVAAGGILLGWHVIWFLIGLGVKAFAFAFPLAFEELTHVNPEPFIAQGASYMVYFGLGYAMLFVLTIILMGISAVIHGTD